MALSRDVVIRLLGDAKSAVDAQKAAADAAGVTAAQYRQAERAFDRSTQAMETASRKQRAAMDQVGRGSMIAGATIVAGLGLATKAAMDWESAWTGVLKTVSGSPAQLAKLETGLRGLARTLPATHTEIAAVAEAAGQLGVKTDSILDFTRVMIDLGETTNLSADEAATSIAQMMNVMQTAPGDVDKLGATLVALGNAGASTERDIVQMSQRISGAAAIVGMSEDEVLALANAVASMGIEVESGGSSVSRVLTDMGKAAQMGGDDLNNFAKTAGMSAADFAKAFREDPAEAFASFIEGLAGVQEAGGNVFKILDDLGLSDVRVSQALLGMASSGDLLRESLDLGSQAWEENTALVEEAAKRYDTTAAKTEMARNAINDAAIEIGDVMLPVLASLAEGVADVAKWFADLPDPIQNVIAGLGSVAGVGLLVGGAFLLLAPRVMETYKAFQLLNTAHPGVAAGLSKVGKAAGAAAALAIVGTAVHALDEAMKPAPATMQQYVKSLIDLDGSVDALDKRFSGLDEGLGTNIDGFADAIKRVTDPSNTQRLDDFGGALFNVVSFGTAGTGEGAASRRRVLDEINGLDQALSLMVQNGNGELAAQQFELMADEAERNGVSVAELKELFPAYGDALQGIANDQQAVAESAGLQAENAAVLAQNTAVAYSSLTTYAAALGLSEEATADLVEKSNALGESLGAFIDPLGTYTGMLQAKAQAEADAANATGEHTGAQAKSWEDFVGSVHVSFDEYVTALQEQVTAQENWQLNMLMLAGRVSQGTLDELARMGPEGAPLVADLVNRSDAELDVMDDLFARRSQEATNAWGAQLTMAAPVLAEIARKGGQGASDAAAAALRNGTSTLAQIAAQWGVAIASGVNPILTGLGKPRITTSGWDATGFMGPVQLANAEGNLYEQHQAEIARGGAMRVWAEPETGGEAYIPLASSKRTRSMGIWRETGRRLGAPEAQYFADGGFASASSVPKPRSTAPFRSPYSTVADAAMQKVYDEVTAWVTANIEPPAASGGSSTGLIPIMAAARQYVMDTYGIRNIGGFARRNIAGTNVLSDHALGKAIDIMTTNLPLGWQIANDFATGAAHKRFKAENVIWQQSISSNGGRFTGMADRGSPTQNHRDHVHVDTYASGTPYIARDGMAYLHKGEAIVPAGINAASRSMPRIPVGSAGRASAAAPVNVTITGAQVTGTLVVDGDGIARIVNGQVVSAFVAAASRSGNNP